MPDYDAPLQRALKLLPLTRMAEELGIKASAIPQWKHVPVHHVRKVSEATGIPMHELRPDVYRAGEAA